ncbi:hypothetical protein CLOSTASPAR_02207 [[Clostridium] asparagiforme DSM 15981]|uniref:Uncharacterized protein n=1 Tax=[Clostridium] asparagiforme DSM 15981 TaxID=518636 RepID=C0CYY1_9FIRM|nr:hypothetical protein CLOSTASPAR_02207 [[Clostridium] asparagiforme DSM 15981]
MRLQAVVCWQIQKKYIKKLAKTKRNKNNQKQNVDETIQTQYNMVISPCGPRSAARD